MQHVTLGNDPRHSIDVKLDLSLHYQGHLFVRMRMLGRDDKRIEGEPADHDIFPYDHLSFDAWCDLGLSDLCPVGNQR